MSFTLILLLNIYYAFLVVWLIFCLVALYHLLKYGFKNLVTLGVIIIFITISALLLLTSFFYINQIDWSTEINIPYVHSS